MLNDLSAVVVHLGTMVGGHYIAYCLVEPEKLFADRAGQIETISDRQMYGDSASHKKDRRVWCYCSE